MTDILQNQPAHALRERLAELEMRYMVLSDLNRYHSAIVDATGDAILMLEGDLTVTGMNRRMARLLGPSAEALPGSTLKEFFRLARHLFPDDRVLKAYLDSIQKRPEGIPALDVLVEHEGTRFGRLTLLPVPGWDGAHGGYVLILRDMTAEKNLEDQLKEEARDREAFVHLVAHDLKNPIAIIMGVTDLLEKEVQDTLSPKGHELMDMMRQECGRILRLIGDVLLFMRMEKGVSLFTKVETAALVNGLVAESQHLHRDTHVIFVVQETLPVVYSHETLLREIFKNLLGNAIKYSDPSKPEVVIEVGCTVGRMENRFYVRDNGIGIPEEYLRQVFEPFFRVGEKEVEGTGLGVSITRRAVEALGGRIWVESTPGRGTTFTFSIPVRGLEG